MEIKTLLNYQIFMWVIKLGFLIFVWLTFDEEWMKGDLFYGSVRLRSCAAGKVHLETLCSTTMSSSSLGLITWKEVSPFYICTSDEL